MHKILNSSYSGRFDDYDFLLRAAEKSVGSGLELSVYSPWHKPEFMARQQALKESFGDLLLTLHGPFEDICAASAPGTLERSRFVDAWKYAFDQYEYFEARSIVLHTHKAHHIAEADKNSLRCHAVEAIQEVADMAVARRIRLTIENVGYWMNGSVLFNEEEYIALFDALPPQVGSLIDIGHALINRWDVTHVIHTLNSRIFSYHLHNNCGCKDSHRPLFEAGNRYTADEMRQLLLTTNRCSPEADWILEYAFGEHVTVASLTHDMTCLKTLNGVL